MIEIIKFADIGLKAVEYNRLQHATKMARHTLVDAYVAWKKDRNIGHLSSDSADWADMMTDTTAEYKAWERAKQDEYNAKQRLRRIIERS